MCKLLVAAAEDHSFKFPQQNQFFHICPFPAKDIYGNG